VAYADPPYPGCARRYYGSEEVDHVELVARLVEGFPDGWALSTSARAALDVADMIRAHGITPRLCPWFNGSRGSRSYGPRSSFEVVWVVGGRPVAHPPGERCDDALVAVGRQRSHPGAMPGMKSAAFCSWLFGLLGLRQGDELEDLFPGTGAVARAWGLFQGGSVAPRATTRRVGPRATYRVPRAGDDLNVPHLTYQDPRIGDGPHLRLYDPRQAVLPGDEFDP